jgi:hypothetical protein
MVVSAARASDTGAYAYASIDSTVTGRYDQLAAEYHLTVGSASSNLSGRTEAGTIGGSLTNVNGRISGTSIRNALESGGTFNIGMPPVLQRAATYSAP